jgi:hypothetical protein
VAVIYPPIWAIVQINPANRMVIGMVAAERTRAQARKKLQTSTRWSDLEYRIVRYDKLK